METHITKTINSNIYIRLGLINDFNVRKSPEILSILSNVLEKSIHTNEKLLKRSRKKDIVTIFHGTRAPTLSIRRYIDRVFEYSRCSPSCLVVAYVYLDWFIQQTSSYVTSLNVHRLLVTCVLVAVKFLEDEHYDNSYFAKIGGISRAEMNNLEMKLLSTLNYKLHVSIDTFNQYCMHLEKEGASSSTRHKWSIRNYGLKGGSWLHKDGSGRHRKCDRH
ncbi:cyclin-U1-1-like [Silene latifolia]|uniref:cyclin-U1-1-like n=1 Tax=Silene latifolia TaxID=37657 RepID=UPI003D777240